MNINEQVYQHYRPQEHVFIKQIYDKIARCQDTYSYQLTAFLNPRQVRIASDLCRQSGVCFYSSTDTYPTELARCLIAPDYYELDVSDYAISLLDIQYARKFSELHHHQVLGTIIGELGIKREVFGDILKNKTTMQIMVDSTMVSYFQENITKIARTGVELREVPLEQLITPEEDPNLKLVLSSSLRLDKLIAETMTVSRSQAVKLIASEKVKVNYVEVSNSSEQVFEGDLISVRGFGRLRLKAIEGKTKSGKYKLQIEYTKRK